MPIVQGIRFETFRRPRPRMVPEFREARAQDIVRLRKAGESYISIGKRWGISRERCRQIYEAATS
jgi:hypothetical protein